MSLAKPVNAKILEINVISAQNLNIRKPEKPSNAKTYVVAYIDRKHRLITKAADGDCSNPNWNEKFVFVVDESFLSTRPNCCLMFEICRSRKGVFGKKEKKIGVAHVLLEDLMITKEEKILEDSDKPGCKFLAFNVLDLSGATNGILNAGVATMDCMFKGNIPTDLGSISIIDCRKFTGDP